MPETEGRGGQGPFPAAGDVTAVVLAAGRGTRFRSERPKVLHEVAGRTLVGHVLGALAPLGLARLVVVVGDDGDDVATEVRAATDTWGLEVDLAVQAVPRGTGDAVAVALAALGAAADRPTAGRVLVVPGDTPLVTTGTFAALLAAASEADVALLTTEPADPTGYGRIVRDGTGAVRAIVEHRDASPEERDIREVNAGMYVAPADRLAEALVGLEAANDQGELYLTDAIGRLVAAGARVVGVVAPADEVAGVNDRRQLAEAGAVLRSRHLDWLMREVGVTVLDPASTHVDVDVVVGTDTTLMPGTILDRGTVVGSRAVIGPHTHLSACVVGDEAIVHSSRADGAEVGDRVEVGPFAHLRPGTRLLAGSRVGAFVQTKNATVGSGSKVPHLAYLGDAIVGEGANVACGVVTVNFDGHEKHATIIGDEAFVGCGVMLVAPVEVGSGAYVAAGSTITRDVPADALAIGRARQEVKPGWAARRRAARARRAEGRGDA